MSPARARTSYDDIVAAGRELLEAGGLDAVTMLAVAERVGYRAVVATVPSHEDDNPEHIHLFDAPALEALLYGVGARRVTVQQVPGHYIALVDVGGEHVG